MIGYPTLALGMLVAYLQVPDETRPFVKGAFGIGIFGECGAPSGAVYFTQPGISMLEGLIAWTAVKNPRTLRTGNVNIAGCSARCREFTTTGRGVRFRTGTR